LTRLAPNGDGFRLDGAKKWVTGAPSAERLLVVASVGSDDRGLNRLRLVSLASNTPGVTLETMPPTPFTPEILHARVRFHEVRVAKAEVLPGDGYDTYLKPFRTIEDIHVFAALLAYLLGVGRRAPWLERTLEKTAALLEIFRVLASRPPLDAATHIELAGALELAQQLIDSIGDEWLLVDEETRHAWERDRPLLRTAEKARQERRLSAWTRLPKAPTA
jgi:alkylation response protein AidB-like acyl-CoA dehydrogenase